MLTRNVASIFSLVFAALSITANAVPTPEEPLNEEVLARQYDCGEVSVSVALLRGYSPSAEDHFYTTNAIEMEKAVSKLGYKSEGDPGRVFSSQVGVTIPLYRMYSATATDHFYTTSKSEADNAVDKLGYTAEGTTAFVYSDQICGSIPFYRMYSPTATDHFYTTSESERDNAIANLGYVDEGIQCYILPTDD
ncbi:uncharacterized protein LAESUDRAFT_814535 [Laetiporus sulphureus 93-53]|uniref:DUF5648 domain-containing protein n=1 Tax=Laetiporus sulphureus 93-53 TaxID=1314785 RepID=A0A165CXH2_9APHY|nr:uncharacterized protein LAESUDRAFT_814535 [Laetiporus sulphureus 93-53]KZT03671.1 hypothetical protein LAESUDRAFT_814535 [Laetiporus sulphureus 93-53]